MINSIVHSKTYLFSLPPDLRQHAVESYAVSLRSTFKAMAVVSALALVAAWRIEEFGLGESRFSPFLSLALRWKSNADADVDSIAVARY